MRVLLGRDVPSWAQAAFRNMEQAITALEQRVHGDVAPMASTRLILPSSRSKDPKHPEVRYDSATKRIEVYDASTDSWKYVELT